MRLEPRCFRREGRKLELDSHISIDYLLNSSYASHPRSLRGVSGDDPEGGARSGVLRRRLVTARLGRLGTRRPGTTTWVRGARCDRSGANAGERSAAPEPKTATVERRGASVRVMANVPSTALHTTLPQCG